MRSPPVSCCPATREPPTNRVPKTMPVRGEERWSGRRVGAEPGPCAGHPWARGAVLTCELTHTPDPGGACVHEEGVGAVKAQAGTGSLH